MNFFGGYARVNSKLRWFSSGKPITSIAISQLVGRKLLRYDDKIVEIANITYIANKCIKQEYQRLFLKMNPVFPALK